MTERTIKINEVEKRLQFTIVLGLFFPVKLQALFSLSGTAEHETASTVLKVGLLISVLIANYLAFEWRKHSISTSWLKYLDWCYLSTITCYGLIFLFLAFTANENIDSVYWLLEIVYSSILVGAMYIPLVSLGVIIIEFFISKLSK